MKKCLVTGANGFLGNALTKRLAELQINVLAIVKNKEGLVDSNYIKYIEFDLDNVKKLHEAVSDRDIDCCFHFAWNGSAGPLRADYYHQLKNVENSCDLISELKRINCSKIVFAASIMEFECLQSLESG
ncbi:MAG: NAD-dependent epimerase/dehydratase family protein, partial [Eubacterium sp.]|nr:NAD-dependent epimerase/dehydratase family protein [Eubacterium sp.]